MAAIPALDDRRRLIQELLSSDWERFVANILLNRTRGDVVRKVTSRVLTRWPTARALAMADVAEVARMIKPCGLQNVKAARLVAMSRVYMIGGWSSPEDLPGIGKYGGDSWRLFDGPMEGRTRVRPIDAALRRYVARVEREGRIVIGKEDG